MDTQQITALTRAMAEVPGPPNPSGVIHVVVPHTRLFTIIGNHLAQHRDLSLVALGLAVHIQSLPTGAKVGIKVLAARFPDSETRIASALRELEKHGYLRRTRCRLASGRIVTRTVSYNRPGTTPQQAPTAPAPSVAATAPPPPGPPAPVPVPEQPRRAPAPAPVLVPAPTAPKPPPPPLPQPVTLTPELHTAATAFLADLRRHAPQLMLSAHDIGLLAPAVATWLERDAHPDTLRRALTADLPHPLKHPAKLLKHRLTALLPPPLPGTSAITPARRTVPLQNCDGCDRAFRSTEPGHCRDCRYDLQAAA
ncbi:helix-turn-helix domain-containing protein [Streptomyces fulvorobeus]|nr:helix-turn-helix domain-containing protein [Streptomyces fulvorobeus]